MFTNNKKIIDIINERIVAHLDMDAFFAAVEERDNPRIQGLPIVVGSEPLEGKGRGVVSTANYKAREYGICSGLPISRAWQFSEQAKRAGKPEAVFFPVNFQRYQEVSNEIMEIVRKYSTLTEQASIDEMYLDLSFLKRSFRKAQDICKRVKKEIWEKEKLTASIGLGPNKLIAKIASDMQKPDGLTIIEPDKVAEFLEPLSIRKIPGVGPKMEQYFNKLGIRRIRDLKKYTKEEMRTMLGKWGGALYDKIRGIDETPVTEEYEAKSIGEQETFPEDTLNFSEVIARLEVLCESIFRSFQKSDFRTFRAIVVTIRFSDFDTKTRSHTLLKTEKKLKVLKIEAMKPLMPFFDARENPGRKKIRLIGARIEKLGK